MQQPDKSLHQGGPAGGSDYYYARVVMGQCVMRPNIEGMQFHRNTYDEPPMMAGNRRQGMPNSSVDCVRGFLPDNRNDGRGFPRDVPFHNLHCPEPMMSRNCGSGMPSEAMGNVRGLHRGLGINDSSGIGRDIMPFNHSSHQPVMSMSHERGMASHAVADVRGLPVNMNNSRALFGREMMPFFPSNYQRMNVGSDMAHQAMGNVSGSRAASQRMNDFHGCGRELMSFSHPHYQEPTMSTNLGPAAGRMNDSLGFGRELMPFNQNAYLEPVMTSDFMQGMPSQAIANVREGQAAAWSVKDSRDSGYCADKRDLSPGDSTRRGRRHDHSPASTATRGVRDRSPAATAHRANKRDLSPEDSTRRGRRRDHSPVSTATREERDRSPAATAHLANKRDFSPEDSSRRGRRRDHSPVSTATRGERDRSPAATGHRANKREHSPEGSTGRGRKCDHSPASTATRGERHCSPAATGHRVNKREHSPEGRNAGRGDGSPVASTSRGKRGDHSSAVTVSGAGEIKNPKMTLRSHQKGSAKDPRSKGNKHDKWLHSDSESSSSDSDPVPNKKKNAFYKWIDEESSDGDEMPSRNAKKQKTPKKAGQAKQETVSAEDTIVISSDDEILSQGEFEGRDIDWQDPAYETQPASPEPGYNVEMPASPEPAPDAQLPDAQLSVTELSVTELSVTELSDTELSVTELSDTELPDIRLPDIGLPDIGLPDIEFPDIELPDIELPEIELPATPQPSHSSNGQSESDDCCHICFESWENITHRGQLHPCGCKKACYPCALQNMELYFRCPWCREPNTFVFSAQVK